MTTFQPTFVGSKPSLCEGCTERNRGVGFVPDWVPSAPKIAVLAERPGQNEIIDREPLVGASGFIFNKNFLFRLGYTRADVLIANSIRCSDPVNDYVTGGDRIRAELHCRQYDAFANKTLTPGGLDAFDPDWCVITMHPAHVLRTWSLLRVVQNDFEKAFRFAKLGKRPIVLLGDVAKRLVLPDIPDGVSKWRGHNQAIVWSDVKKRLQTRNYQQIADDDDVPF